MPMSSSTPLGQPRAPSPIGTRLVAVLVLLSAAAVAWAWLGHHAPRPPEAVATVVPRAAVARAARPAAGTTPAAVISTAAPTAPAQPTEPPAFAVPPAAAMPPSFDIVRVGPRGDAVLAGRAKPGAQVVIADNGHPIARAEADAQGQWVALPAAPLPAGGQQLTLSTTPDHPGQAVAQGAAPVVVVVPPAFPAAGQPANAGALALLTPPAGMPLLLQAPASPESRPESRGVKPGTRPLGLGIVDYDTHGAIRFAGSAPPGSAVRVYIDRRPAGDAVADEDGRWSLLPADPVAAGQHRLRIDQLKPSGAVAARVALPFDRVLLPEGAVMDGRVVVQPGQCLWRIARKAYGQGVRYTVIYLANRSQIRNPDLIYPGQVFAVPAAPGATPPKPAPVASSTAR